jgi:exodeoxyribonuclease V alpha subunit
MNNNHNSDAGHSDARPKEAETQELSGTVESIVFRAEDTGYTVCSVKLPGQKDSITVVGTSPAIWVGENLKTIGVWVRHKQHGHQFQAESMTCIAPTSAKGIERYLASGMIRGIGKVNAKRIVDAFGKQTLRIIEKDSKRLEEVPGIGPGRRQMIRDSWIRQHAVRDIMIFLQSHGVGTAQSARIYRLYGSEAIDLISENPYRLCSDVWGIGFRTADSVAISMGVPSDSDVRARAGIVHVLQTMKDDGHCFCMEPELILQAQALLDIPDETLVSALKQQIKHGVFVQEEKRIFLSSLHKAESTVVERIKRIINLEPSFRPIETEKAIAWAKERTDLAFSSMQVEALHMALSSKMSVITGGPGVGKTTIIKALVDVFATRRLKIALSAPTGRAAKRMEEATGRSAMTIHRLLKFLPQTASFSHNHENPLDIDILILDEVSMIDIELAASLLSAVPDSACVVFVGDIDQLPSVGPGNVLGDLIESGVIPFKRLDTIFRQETGGWIVSNAHRVNNGERIQSPSDNDASDFFFLETQDPEQVIQRMLHLVSQRIPKKFSFDPLRDIQVLTPMRKNQLGSENLNAILQETLNPGGPCIQRFGRNYRTRDRVMQIRNNYDKEVFNGDIGQIESIDSENETLVVNFEGRKISYELPELDELVHAYACTIHKSQGSEYPAVVILLATQHYTMLQRNLLYTAITRGKKLVCLIGSSKAVMMATKNNKIKLRRTGLRRRLSGK